MTDHDGESALAKRLAGIPAHDRYAVVLNLVMEETAALLERDVDSVDPERAYQDYGYSSLAAVELTNRLARSSGIELPLTMLFDHPNPSAVAGYLVSRVSPEREPTPSVREVPTEQAADDPLAVVGMACRYPGGVRSADDLWELVDSGVDAVSSFPPDRGWDLDALHGDSDRPGTSQTGHGGFLHDATDFDADFFGVGPREATAMDPQHRLLLETTWEALEHAGIDPAALRRSPTGVFVGLSTQDYSWLVGARPELDGQWGIGTASSVASGRIAYMFGLEGVALTVDTACSSSLVALHYAGRSLRAGDCTIALVGGVSVLATPALFTEFSRQRGLAPDGRCKSFSERADGTGWSEGVGMLVVERLSEARRQGHDVLALVRGSAVNQDGRSNGLTAPHGPSQIRVIQRALHESHLDPSDVDIVEAHGTGTELGDPIEANALLDTYGTARPTDRPLRLGTLKSNIGHAQAAAGVGGIIKMVQAFRHERMPRTLHATAPTTKVDWSKGSISLLTEPFSWPRCDRPRRAGVSAFGISGTNAHVILEEGDESEHAAAPVDVALPAPVPWLLAARNEQALRAQAHRLRAHVTEHPELCSADIGYSLATTRAALEHRAVVVGADRAALLDGLDAVASGRRAQHVVTDVTESRGKVAFLFTGQGSQRPELGRALARTYPVFDDSLAAACAELDEHLERPVRAVMFAPESSPDAELIHRTEFTQAMLFAFEVALFRLVESWGIRPHYVLGHSIGELGAAHVAGVLSLTDASALVAARGKLMGELASGGAMAALQASEKEVSSAITEQRDSLALAAVNGPRSVVVSGAEAAVEACARHWAERGRRTERLRVSRAFHSPLMEPMLPEFAEVAGRLSYREPHIPLVSNVTGAAAGGDELCHADYWVRHAREPVRFDAGVRWLEQAGVTNYLELGPHAVLTALGGACLSDEGRRRSRMVPAQHARRPECEAVVTAVGELHAHGVDVDRGALFADRGARRVRLPGYAFQRRRFWPDARSLPDRQPAPKATEPARPSAAGSPEEDVVTLVRRHVAAVLGHDSGADVDPERSFLDLGLDSMGALELHNRLVAATGREFSAAVLVDRPTPAALADYLDPGAQDGGPTTQPLAPEPGGAPDPSRGTMTALLYRAHAANRLGDTVGLLSDASRFQPQFDSVEQLGDPDVTFVSDGSVHPRLLCVPSFLAGSGPHQFARFAAGLPRRRHVGALTLPGFRPGDPHPASWDALIGALASAIRKRAGDEPFVLVGYSIGGVFAHALAGALEDDVNAPGGVILIDTHEPGHSEQASVFAWAMGAILDRDERLLSVTEENALAMGSYLRVFDDRPRSGPRAPSLLVRATDRPSEPVSGWKPWAEAEHTRSVPGDHFSIMEENAHGTAEVVDTWLVNTFGDA